jgi:hypothetical protein
MPLLTWKEDTFIRGCISGLLAGIVKNSLDFCLIMLRIKSNYFWKISSVIIFSKPPHGFVENMVAVVVELIFCSFIGVVYTLIRTNLKTRYPLVMGMFYGALVWFFIKTSFLLFHISEFKKDLAFIPNPISHLLLSILYGAIVAYLECKWSTD